MEDREALRCIGTARQREALAFLYGRHARRIKAFALRALRDELKLVIKECWANVNERYAYNQPHTHANALLSGAYYVQVPPGHCGHLVLIDPRSQPWVLQPEYAERNIANTPMQRLPPEAGRLVVFPSWLEHSVEQNLSGGERVSMSFNVDLVPAAMVAAARER